MDDEPLYSPRRLLLAIRQWLWFVTLDPPIDLTLGHMLRYHRRPHAAHRDGAY